MLTYQDLEKVKETGNIDKLMNFVLSVKEEHENSDLYETAVLANEYDKQQKSGYCGMRLCRFGISLCAYGEQSFFRHGSY